LSQNPFLSNVPKVSAAMQVKPLATESRVTCPKWPNGAEDRLRKNQACAAIHSRRAGTTTPHRVRSSNRVQRHHRHPPVLSFRPRRRRIRFPATAPPATQTGSETRLFPVARPSGPRKTGIEIHSQNRIDRGGWRRARVCCSGELSRCGNHALFRCQRCSHCVIVNRIRTTFSGGQRKCHPVRRNPSSRTNPPRPIGHLIPKTSMSSPPWVNV